LKPLFKNILILVIFNALLLLAGLIISGFLTVGIHFSDVIIASLVFSAIAIITMLIFFKGQTKEPDSQTLHSLVALSLKFLFELIFALLWFFVAKKTSLESVLIFFVLYLALSLFSIMVLVKTLKNKVL
jgi:hypothetical protein